MKELVTKKWKNNRCSFWRSIFLSKFCIY